MYQSILFPIDFSLMAEAVAPQVRGLADWTEATVTLLHVIPWLCPYGSKEPDSFVVDDLKLQRLTEEAELSLEIFREKYFADIPSHREIKVGSVAETIINTADQHGVDLIMMPTRGTGPYRRFLIGSTAAKVLHDARCPVWTSPHRSSIRPFVIPRNILCALDRDEVPCGYLEEAVRLSTCFGSRLSFITAIPSTVGGYGDERKILSVAREFPQAHLHQATTPADCMVLTETGTVGEVVRQAVEDHHADLVLINRGHLQQPYRRFETRVFDIVLESPCPVLSLCISSSLANQESLKIDFADITQSKVCE